MLIAWVLTVFLECLVLFILQEREKLLYVYWIAITSFTNLLANLYLAVVFKGNTLEYWLTAIVIEIIVYTAEFLLCWFYTNDKRKSLIYSIACNSASFFIGLLVSNIINKL